MEWQGVLALLVCAATFIVYLAAGTSRTSGYLRSQLDLCRAECARKDHELEELREINATLMRRIGQLRGALDGRV